MAIEAPPGLNVRAERMRRWYARNRDRQRAVVAAYGATHRTEAKNRRLVRLYGLTLAEKHALVAAQAGRCAICECDLTSLPEGRVHIDHDHRTGRVRGVLCHGCNVGLGHFDDDPATLLRALEYMRHLP